MTDQAIAEVGTRKVARRVDLAPRVKRLVQQILIYVLLLLIFALAVVPLLWALAASFTPLEKVFKYTYPFSWRALFPVEFTLEAYQNVFFERGLDRAIVNTLILGFATVLLGGLISAMAGFAFAMFDFRGKNLLFAIILFTFMVPVEVTIIPLYILVNRLAWINTWQGLLVPGLANSLVIFLFRQFFAEIPRDLTDAARVDGASWLKIFAGIVLPLSKPALISAGLILFLSQWDAFFWPLVVAPKAELRLIQVAISLSIEQYRTVWNELLAGSMLAAIIPILLVLPFQRYYVRGIVGTGIKD
jgi:multiple sugar transport system permease protein/putative chitobiose transport system permease protein